MKKLLSIGMVLFFVFASLVGKGNTALAKEDPLVDYEMTSPYMTLGETMNFYSINKDAKIEKDAEIVFQREDGTKKSYKSITFNEGKSYLFQFKLDQTGLWKLVELDGKPVESRSRDFMVYKNQEEPKKASDEELHKIFEAKQKKAAKQKGLIWDGKMEVIRLSGKDRYETAIKTSEYTFKEGSKYVVVATGENFIDGLVGGSLTAQVEAPLLLVRKDSISMDTLNEIKRLNPEEVIILGGQAAVSEKAEKEISKLGIKIDRLAGENRVETAEKIGKKRESLLLQAFDKKKVALINGIDFPDALAAAPYIGEMAKIGKEFYTLMPYMKGFNYPQVDLAFGGEKAVPLTLDPNIRIGGSDRYSTGSLIASYSVRTRVDDIRSLNKKPDTLVLVSGKNFPDGLTAASVASTKNGVVQLIAGNVIPETNIDFLMEYAQIEKVIIIGGEQAVGRGVENIFTGKDLPPEIHGYRFGTSYYGLGTGNH